MRFETRSRIAFENVAAALKMLNRYEETKDTSHLATAEENLTTALKEDPEYLNAVLYSGVIKDRGGKPADAVEDFQKLLDSIPSDDRILRLEILYNLAVAHYHQYRHSELEKAIPLFKTVAEEADDDLMVGLARAGLAQACAMHMIPKDLSKPESQAHAYSELCKQEAARAGEIADRLRTEGRIEESKRVFAMSENALGMALMYQSDYSEDHKQALLTKALEHFCNADAKSPRDWANYCDIGSAHMRLGKLTDSAESFAQAEHYLRTVVERLRPGYGFALYELGRNSRLAGRFKESLNWLKAAKDVPLRYRDVGDPKVDREISLATDRSRQFP